MTRPTLHVAVAGTKNTASDYNENFTKMLDYLDTEISGAKTYVAGYMPSQSGKSGKFLKTNGTVASWEYAIPIGTILYGGYSSAPSGWLVCDGSAVSRSAYPDLYSVIGTTFGAGDGTVTFNLPNLIDKYVCGSTTVGTSITPTETNTSSNGKSHSHTYLAGDSGALSTGSTTPNHTHTYDKGVNAITLLPIIKY